jgi:hypothetical protein
MGANDGAPADRGFFEPQTPGGGTNIVARHAETQVTRARLSNWRAYGHGLSCTGRPNSSECTPRP